MTTLHHIGDDGIHLDAVAACGTTAWLWITTSWEETTCPYCLATRAKVCTRGEQLVADGEIENEPGTRTKRITRCVYPDWEGGTTSGDHQFGRDGVCVICGEKNDIAEGTDTGMLAQLQDAGFGSYGPQ